MIEAKNISKTYNPRTRKANTVLQDASITFPDSGFVFIVGRSGTGKSTILNAMGGLISYQGEILFDNKTVDIDKYRAKNIGFVFQDFLLFDDLSVRENIKISLNIAGIYDEDEVSKRTEVLLKAVGLNINSKRKAYALSLGQRQRVAIARTLASNPHIILADEPTGNLDSKNSIIVMDILKKLSVDHLVICVTHNTNLVKLYADKAFAIVDKKFSEIDPATEKLEETYASSSRIEIGQMEEKEYQDENFLVKFYSSNGDSKQDEIKIVKKDGKILVIGENVSLASPSQLVEATASSDPGKKKEELKAIDLNFDNSAVKNKRTFKDSLLYSYFSSLFYSNRKLKKSTQFLKLVNTVLPMILMVILSAVFVMLNTVKTYSAPTYANTDNVIGLINDDYLNDKTLTAINSIKPEEVYKLVYQEDTGLIETDSTNYSKITENYAPNYSSTFTIDNFSLSDKLSNKNNIGNYSFSLRTSAIDNYLTIDSLNSSLKNFSNLKDDEIVIDETYLTNINYTYQSSRISFYNLPLIDGKLFKDELVGSYFNIPFNASTVETKYQAYQIVGISSTGINTIFTSKNTDLKLKNSYLNFYDFRNYQDWSEYEIVNYDDIKSNPDYTFSSLEDGNIKLEDSFSSFVNTKKGYSAAISSPNLLNDLYSFFIENQESNNIISNGFITENTSHLIINRECTVSSVSKPDKKIICFFNYTKNDGSLYNSMSSYFSNYLFSKEHMSTAVDIPENLTSVKGNKPDDASYFSDNTKTLYIPQALYEIIKEDGKTYPLAGVYQSSNIYDPIYTCKAALFSEYYQNNLTVSYSTGNYNNPYTSLASSGNLFFSNDPAKTIAFFNNHSEYRLKAMTYTELYKDFVYPASFESIKSLFIVAVVILGIIILISILNSVSDVNKNKRDIGVLRCLGKSKSSIFWSDMLKQMTETVASSFFYCLIIYLLLSFFALNGYNFGFFLLFYLMFLFVTFISQGAPLLFVLSKKPNDIIRTLN